MIIYYTVPEIWCVTDVIIFHCRLLPFTPPPLTAQKIKMKKKMKKNPRDMIVLHMCTKNYYQMMYFFLALHTALNMKH